MSDQSGDHSQSGRRVKLLTVHVEARRFLISLAGVRKIVPAMGLDYNDLAIDGFIASKSIDDEVYPVIDLAARFSPSRVDPILDSACLVVVETHEAPLSLLVDSIGAVFSLCQGEINQTGVLEGKDEMPGRMGFANLSGESLEVFDPVHLATERDREVVRNWRGPRAALRSLGGLEEKERAAEAELSGDQKKLAGTYLVVRVNDTTVGFRTCDVIEVLPDSGVLFLPDAAPNFCGVLPLRGSCYPILDLGVHLGMEQVQRLAARASLVLLHDQDGPSGFRVEEIVGRFKVEGSEIDLLDWSIPIHRRFYLGTFHLEGQSVALVNAKVLLEDQTEPLLVTYERLMEDEHLVST